MKFVFESESEDSGAKVSHVFEAFTWYEALNQFVKFLRGSGYNLQNHSVGINTEAGHIFLEGYNDFSNITFFEQEKESD